MSNFVKRALLLFAIANTILNIVMFVLIFMPRDRTRAIRHRLAQYVMALWISSGRLWTMLHDDLWQKGNGHEH